MLLNDVTRNDKMNEVHARDLQNAVVRHHQNNPHVSMEAAFEYIMSISSTYRALPIECIEKARRYLALPNQEDDAKAKFKQESSEKLSDIFSGLNEALQDLADSGQPLVLIPFELPESEGATPIGITEYDLTHRKISRLSTHDLWEFINLVSDSRSDSETLGHTFGRVRRETHKFFKMNPIDIHDAWTQLAEMQGNKPKPGTTVVHAERVVVDNKKMIKILRFDNVEYAHNLPKEYTDKSPHFYVRPGSPKDGVWLSLLINNDTFSFDIMPGDKMYVADFNRRISAMKDAGARLTKINKTAKLEREHRGKFTVSV